MEKKLYWLIENNSDLSLTCSTLEECMQSLEADFESFNDAEKQDTQYTITPVWYTDEEYAKLPEA